MQANEAIGRALGYLKSRQQADGSFLSYSSPRQVPFKPRYTYATTFTPALILAALHNIEHPDAMAVRGSIATLLLGQKSTRWSFNYWLRNSNMADTLPYPDDLDDTFCALSALWLYDPSLIDQTALANTVKLLIATESRVGGPYRTWLAGHNSDAAWRDIDLAVNANIAYFLSLVSNIVPNLAALMDEAIEQEQYTSPYYPNEYPVLYYLSRAYRGAKKQMLAGHILHRRQADGSWGAPLHTALAVTSLVRLGQPVPQLALEALLAQQQADGSWPAAAFCLDPTRGKTRYFNGSPALTTAFVAEALHAAHQTTPKPAVHQPAPNHKPNRIMTAARAELTALDHGIRNITLDALSRIAASTNGNEITQLPRLFYKSLKAPEPLPARLFTDLSLANLYGWTAYTIYDDFLDGEGQTRLLSSANILMRRSAQAFERALPGNAAFSTYVRGTFDTIDAANAWEVTHCRATVSHDSIKIPKLPDYKNLDRLAERSLGHALTPMGILAALGMPVGSRAARSIVSALRHYLIARQLNDDAHDWRTDLMAGRLTFVLTTTLQLLQAQPSEYALNALLPKIERTFWTQALTESCKHITTHIGLGRQALLKCPFLLPRNILEQLLDGIEAANNKTRASITQAEQFLQAYRTP